MKTQNYVKKQVKQEMGMSNAINKKQQKKINRIVLVLGSLLGASTAINIVNMILLILQFNQ